MKKIFLIGSLLVLSLPLFARGITASTPVDSCADFTVPNVFTPNGDGINDVFAVSDTSLTNYSITIYDRYGQVEFYSTSPNISWDGHNNGGVEVSDGVYYYILHASCGGNTYNKQGFLYLLR